MYANILATSSRGNETVCQGEANPTLHGRCGVTSLDKVFHKAAGTRALSTLMHKAFLRATVRPSLVLLCGNAKHNILSKWHGIYLQDPLLPAASAAPVCIITSRQDIYSTREALPRKIVLVPASTRFLVGAVLVALGTS